MEHEQTATEIKTSLEEVLRDSRTRLLLERHFPCEHYQGNMTNSFILVKEYDAVKNADRDPITGKEKERDLEYFIEVVNDTFYSSLRVQKEPTGEIAFIASRNERTKLVNYGEDGRLYNDYTREVSLLEVNLLSKTHEESMRERFLATLPSTVMELLRQKIVTRIHEETIDRAYAGIEKARVGIAASPRAPADWDALADWEEKQSDYVSNLKAVHTLADQIQREHYLTLKDAHLYLEKEDIEKIYTPAFDEAYFKQRICNKFDSMRKTQRKERIQKRLMYAQIGAGCLIAAPLALVAGIVAAPFVAACGAKKLYDAATRRKS